MRCDPHYHLAWASSINNMRSQLHNGWAIQFQKNVHMYCHSLKVSKGGRQYEIPCEDSPMSDGLVAMWLYELTLDEAASQDLLKGLTQWAQSSGMKYRIYLTKNDYQTNDDGP